MYAMTTLTKRESGDVFFSFVRNNIYIDTSEKVSSIVIFDKKFDDLSFSFYHLVSRMIMINVSSSVLYWIAACLEEIQSQSKINFTARNIHYYVLMLHCIGVKLIEDVPISINIYMKALGIDPKEKGLIHEYYILNLVLSVANPYVLINQKRIDDKILKIISSVTHKSFENLKLYEDTKIEECVLFYDCVDNTGNTNGGAINASIINTNTINANTINANIINISDPSTDESDTDESDTDDSDTDDSDTDDTSRGTANRRKNKKIGFGSLFKSVMMDIISSTKQLVQSLTKLCRN